MRGLIFNYLISYIDTQYGYETVDTIINRSALDNNGAYANGGLYDDKQFFTLVINASSVLQIPPSQLQESCGKFAFQNIYEKLITIYNNDVSKHKAISNAFDFISMLEVIHYQEVVKLYPNSAFPHFDIISHDDKKLVVYYRSKRNLPYLAKGLLEGCIVYFKEPLSLQMQDDVHNNGTYFTIQKV